MRRAQLVCFFRYSSLKEVSDDVAGTMLVHFSKTSLSFAESDFGAASTAETLDDSEQEKEVAYEFAGSESVVRVASTARDQGSEQR